MHSGDRYLNVLAEVQRVALECGRNPEDVLLIGVSKTVGVSSVQDAISCGANDFGENRPACLEEKATALPACNWHFIGNIQSRAIPTIVAHATLIHSVFEERHLRAIDKAATKLDKVQDVLIEVNISGEESKGGTTPEGAAELVALAEQLEHVRVRGLMTMAPQGDLSVARQTFEGLSALHAQLRGNMTPKEACAFSELSMGMSEDWREAIAAGATIIRVGRAIFSDTFAS